MRKRTRPGRCREPDGPKTKDPANKARRSEVDEDY